MAMFYDKALELLSKDITTALVLFAAGFLVCHLFHAIIFAATSGFGKGFDKIIKFFKALFFIYK